MRPFDESTDMRGNFLRPFAKRAGIDDRVVRIIIDIGRGRKDPMDAKRASFTRRRVTFHPRRLQVIGCAISHRVRELSRICHSHACATLEVAADKAQNGLVVELAVSVQRNCAGRTELIVEHGQTIVLNMNEGNAPRDESKQNEPAVYLVLTPEIVK